MVSDCAGLSVCGVYAAWELIVLFVCYGLLRLLALCCGLGCHSLGYSLDFGLFCICFVFCLLLFDSFM